ncbi:50S ribosomal protein L24 [Candidatus Hepatincolaceae symbiont of Richtersius coronifer]
MIVKSKIKKDDKVIIITGKDKSKTGTILKVFPSESKVIVEGVNIVKKHQKPTPTNAGGLVSKEVPIHISNVALLDPSKGKPTKIGYKVEDGKKVRYCKLSGNVLEA